MLPRDRERLQSLVTRALAMAESGLHQDWRSIEHALLQTGRVDATRSLLDPRLRAKLDGACARARPKGQRHVFGLRIGRSA